MSEPRPAEIYQLLRNLTSPVVAITSQRGGKGNGMIIDSAIRASIVPDIPRLALFIHKFNFSHGLIFESGRLTEKLAGVPHRPGTTGVPILDECHAHFECRVVNAMDTGSSTCFLGDVVAVGFGAATAPRGDVMTAAYFREHLPAAWRPEYERHLKAAQDHARATSHDIAPLAWTRR